MDFLKFNRQLGSIVTFACAVTLLWGSVFLMIAYPSFELISAVAFEVLMVSALFAYRRRSARVKADNARLVILGQLEEQWFALKVVRRLFATVTSAVLIGCFVVLSSEVSGMTAAFFGKYNAARLIYTRLPTASWFGFHPAYSLEVLTGAYIGAGRYDKAEPFYPLILSIRLKLFGQDTEFVPGFYADVGDLRLREGRLKEAEDAYRYAVLLCEKAFGDTNRGKVLTKLGNLLTREGRYTEADSIYQEALIMRARQFGDSSLKVAETLHCYSRLLFLTGRERQARAMQKEENDIVADANPNSVLNTAVPLLVLVISLGSSYFLFGRRGYLTNLALNRLRVKAADNQDPKLYEKQLEALTKFRETTPSHPAWLNAKSFVLRVLHINAS